MNSHGEQFISECCDWLIDNVTMTRSVQNWLIQQLLKRHNPIQPIAKDKSACTAHTQNAAVTADDSALLISRHWNVFQRTITQESIRTRRDFVYEPPPYVPPNALLCPTCQESPERTSEKWTDSARKREAVVMDTTHSINSPGVFAHKARHTPSAPYIGKNDTDRRSSRIRRPMNASIRPAHTVTGCGALSNTDAQSSVCASAHC